ncbi:HlyD family secretion protein [Peptoniphilus asaccharolyticus DSM 20463]|uniref:HlyD family secretion protein n=1 Tax=Peptoniphilus asaccharolyticus DSM 20463 TaxID=573058 RepID=A0A1W1VIX5_PEPAS|nr:HlyD family efflux transporter periplasmic adaptor subunit [Peptoniphilus asaccharolyticus]MBL7574370.1 HlyD family efflux transporter periplasmic adaptor subunit [Peptoniphilus asaccharolyticus]SMB93278.1 HlyD family secretion protein [Peptoniphilus asaccharolyticus DSM 20463]
MKIKDFILGHKKIVIPAGVILALLIGGTIFGKGGKSKYVVLPKSETTQIKKKDFSNMITESGKVKSEDSVDIFAEKSLPVKNIDVKVGDEVVAGQVIAKLDDSSIRQQIKTKEAMIASTNRSTGAQVKGAKDKLNEAVKGKSDGTNAQVVSANANVLQTYDQWQLAEKTYDDYLRSLNMGYNEAIVAKVGNDTTQQNNLQSQNLTYDQARQKLAEASSNFENARRNYSDISSQADRLRMEDESITREINNLTLDIESEVAALQGSGNGNKDTKPTSEELAKLSEKQDEIRSKKEKLNELNIRAQRVKTQIAEVEGEKAKFKTQMDTNEDTRLALEKDLAQQEQNLANLHNTLQTQAKQDQLSKRSREDVLNTYRKNAVDAKNIYESAKKNLTVALAAQEAEIRALQSGLDQAKASGDNSVNSVDLKNLYEELEKTVVKAPISGTITKMDMVKGQVPTAALAQVQTVKRTIVEAQVKEYDYPKVRVGMEVEITSDALGRKQVFKGKIESIDPTPKSAEATAQGQSQEVAYKTKISIEDTENKLQPGMSVRIKYVLESKKDVIVVPTSAIYKKNDKSFILIVPDKEIAQIKEIEVMPVTGNDVETVITSKDLKGKLRVINSADKYQSGTEVQITEEMEVKK